MAEEKAADTLTEEREPGDLYINRELSMLQFQNRVLEEARDSTNPLLERVKFLAIVDSNLDEFFMVRVGGLKMQNDAGVLDFSIDGLTPAEQLAAIRKHAHQLMEAASTTYQKELLPLLDKAGIHIRQYEGLSNRHQKQLKAYFDEVIFPVLTPLAFDPGHPFPHISNMSLNLAVVIEDTDGKEHFGRVKVPASLPRLVPIKRSSGGVRKDGTVPHHHHFVWIEQLIARNLETLFPGMKVKESYPFRVVRNADVLIQELEASDLLETMEENVRKRRFGAVVHLSVDDEMPEQILSILIENLRVDKRDVYVLDGPLGLSGIMQLHEIDRYDLKYKPFTPAIAEKFMEDVFDGNYFNAICTTDILLHHPYDSFQPVVDFIKTAARDPAVLAIKQTLYRVGRNSPVVNALLEARREYGKQVAVLVELKARFDEESNIGWARKLEREGVHVVYGLLGLKTHSKSLMVVRKEGEHIQRYMHLGTGNYNRITARQYEDFGMFTCDEEIGSDLTDLFNYLTGYSSKDDYKKLLVAPINLRRGLTELIEREITLHKKHGKGHLIFKANALVDKGIINLLYKASQAGVKVDLIIRSVCCLRPGIKGLSENIRVISVVGRFLEHSRIYYFNNNGDEDLYIGSADLMPRNIDRRVEVLFPIEASDNIRYIRDEVLETYLNDNVKAREMQADGTYKRVKAASKDSEPVYSQVWLMQRPSRVDGKGA
jgi:polyphosphate kinase